MCLVSLEELCVVSDVARLCALRRPCVSLVFPGLVV